MRCELDNCKNEANQILCLETSEEVNACKECTIKTGNYLINKKTGEEVFIPIIK